MTLTAIYLLLMIAPTVQGQMIAPLSSPRWCAAATVYKGVPLFLGGREGDRFLDEAEYLDRLTNQWNRLRPLKRARACLGAVTLRGRVYAVGGEDAHGPLADVEYFDELSLQWRDGIPLPVPLSKAGVVVHQGRMIVLGGVTPRGPSKDVWAYSAKGWERLAPLPRPRWDFGTAVVKGEILIAGGMEETTEGPRAVDRIDAYSTQGGAIVKRGALSSPRSALAATEWKGLLVTAGGLGASREPLAEFSSYDLAKATRTTVCTMEHPRRSMTLVSWSEGLIAAGGARKSNKGRRGLYWRAKGRDICTMLVDPVYDDHGVVYFGPDIVEDSDAAWSPRRERENDLALLIGVSHYKALPRADYADRDVSGVASLFRGLGFSSSSIHEIIDADAGYSAINRELDGWLASKARSDSKIYVYFSGHGSPSTSDGSPYLMPWDGDADYIKSTGISMMNLIERLSRLPSRHVYLVVDACFSGSGMRSAMARGTRPLVAVRQISLPANVSLLSSASGGQTAGTHDARRHGLFTYHFLTGASGLADRNRDGRVTLLELHEHLLREVPPHARKENREQTPFLATTNQSREF